MRLLWPHETKPYQQYHVNPESSVIIGWYEREHPEVLDLPSKIQFHLLMQCFPIENQVLMALRMLLQYFSSRRATNNIASPGPHTNAKSAKS